MKTRQLVSLLALGLLPILASAQTPATVTAIKASEPGKVVFARNVDLNARVVGIDAAARTVTLKGPEGNVVDVVAPDSVKNFAQIKLGDLVVAHYSEAWTVELSDTKAGVRESVETEALQRAKPGDRPAGLAERKIVMLVDVFALDRAKQTITLRGPKNNNVTLPVKDPEQLKLVHVGDQLRATYTQAALLAVEPGK